MPKKTGTWTVLNTEPSRLRKLYNASPHTVAQFYPGRGVYVWLVWTVPNQATRIPFGVSHSASVAIKAYTQAAWYKPLPSLFGFYRCL